MGTTRHTRTTDFDPADYRVEGIFDQHDDVAGWVYLDDRFETGVNVFRGTLNATFEFDTETAGVEYGCTHCGRRYGFRFECYVRYLPTGDLLFFGSHCVTDAWLADKVAFAKKRAQAAIKNAKRRAAVTAARTKWETENPEQSAALDIYAEEAANGGEFDRFLDDLVRARANYGALTEGQTPWPLTAMVTRLERAEREAAKAAKLATTPELTEGRYEIEGRVISTKWQPSDFGDTLKMLVEFDDGNRVWGSVPKALGWDGLEDRRVVFTAAVERSGDDEHFGFFKRPSKAEFLDKEEVK